MRLELTFARRSPIQPLPCIHSSPERTLGQLREKQIVNKSALVLKFLGKKILSQLLCIHGGAYSALLSERGELMAYKSTPFHVLGY